ncbi:SHD1 domain-containing protein [Bythopirellula goksoeyrii]|nr:SHD1 domain-containing protein [Bythopirellula goksoeyrii]
MWTASEVWFPYQSEESTCCGDCEFSEPIVETTHGSGEKELPSSAEVPQTTAPVEPLAEPKVDSPAPAAEKPAPILPAAPIAVPQPEEPIDPPTEELFPGPVPPADDAPLQVEPEKKSQIDELFEEPSATNEPTPSNEPATPPQDSTDALFVEPEQASAEEALPEEESTESEPSGESEDKSDSFEDLFGPTEEEPTPEPKTESEEKPAVDPFDPSGQKALPSVLEGTKSIAVKDPRYWSDCTSQFSCLAHLVSMNAEFVVLEKEAGDRIAVPLTQLSDADLAFVKEQVRNLRMVLQKESLAEKLAMSWSD